MDRCISYESQTFEYIFPSPIIFSTLCLSYDRTEIFIISLIRLFIWFVIYYIVTDNLDVQMHPFVNYGLYALLGINIAYIGIVVAKVPVLSLGEKTKTVQSYEDIAGSSKDAVPYSL